MMVSARNIQSNNEIMKNRRHIIMSPVIHDFIITVMFYRMRGLRTALTDKCGDIFLCEEFISLTPTEIRSYYHAVEFQTLDYAGDFQLPFVQAYENQEQKTSFTTIWQKQMLEDGSIFDVQVNYVHV